MLACTYLGPGRIELREKPKPELLDPRDALVRVTLGSICTSDLHIKHGSVPRAVPGVTVGHEMVGVVEEVGSAVSTVRPGDRVTVNVETFCGECFFCRHGYVNNCTDPQGGWALGCRPDSYLALRQNYRPYFARILSVYRLASLRVIVSMSKFITILCFCISSYNLCFCRWEAGESFFTA